MRRAIRHLTLCLVAVVGCAGPRGAGPSLSGPGPATSVQRVADGVVVRFSEGLLKLEVCAPDVVRVAYASNESFFVRKSLAAFSLSYQPAADGRPSVIELRHGRRAAAPGAATEQGRAGGQDCCAGGA